MTIVPSDLRVSLVQTNVHWHAAEQNREHFDALIDPLVGKSDLVVLPETFTSGFTQAPQDIAESMDGPSIRWMQAYARKANAALCGSMAMRDGEQFFNRFVFVHPDGKVDHYDKRHRFGLGGETERYSAGDRRVVITYRGWRLFPQVCYDLRFPVYSRNDLGYDAAIYVANWPTPRTAAWRALLRARAIENQAFVVAVNRVGQDGNGISYSGASAAIGPEGDDLVDLGDEPRVETFTLRRQRLVDFRTRFPFLADQDRFEILSS